MMRHGYPRGVSLVGAAAGGTAAPKHSKWDAQGYGESRKPKNDGTLGEERHGDTIIGAAIGTERYVGVSNRRIRFKIKLPAAERQHGRPLRMMCFTRSLASTSGFSIASDVSRQMLRDELTKDAISCLSSNPDREVGEDQACPPIRGGIVQV